jgi:hypothetical protein
LEQFLSYIVQIIKAIASKDGAIPYLGFQIVTDAAILHGNTATYA